MNQLSLKSQLVEKVKTAAGLEHPSGLRRLSEDLKEKGDYTFAGVFAQLACTVEAVLGGKEIKTQDLPLGVSIDNVVLAFPHSGSITDLMRNRKYIETYAQLTYGLYLNG